MAMMTSEDFYCLYFLVNLACAAKEVFKMTSVHAPLQVESKAHDYISADLCQAISNG